MKERPLPGDVVRLNDQGMQNIHGLTSAEMVRQAQRMVITYVTRYSMTSPEPTWGITVDQPLINEFILSHHDVDLIERPAVPLPNKVIPKPLELDEAIALGVARVEIHNGVRKIILG
jgi:hypothetical protein